ncbi:MAG: hypothetical protein NVS2B9_07760 [Myxococcales bacterium]
MLRYHIEIRRSFHRAWAFDMGEGELNRRILEPWRRGAVIEEVTPTALVDAGLAVGAFGPAGLIAQVADGRPAPALEALGAITVESVARLAEPGW